LLTWRRAPHNFSLSGVQLQSIGTHPIGYSVNARCHNISIRVKFVVQLIRLLLRAIRNISNHSLLVTSEASDGEKRLFSDLFANYSAEVRPRHESNQSVVISLDLQLVQFKDLVIEYFSVHVNAHLLIFHDLPVFTIVTYNRPVFCQSHSELYLYENSLQLPVYILTNLCKN